MSYPCDPVAGPALARRRALAAMCAGLVLAGLPSCSGSPGAKRPRAEAVPVLAAAAEQKAVPVELEAIGAVDAYNTVAVRSRVAGELTGVYFQEGQDVREGDLLFTVDSRGYEAALKAARADLAREKARAETAEADARRYADLVAKDFVTRQESELAESTAQAERAAVEALEARVESARLDLEYCTLRAPIAGRTGNVRVRQGNLLSANDPQPLVTINRVRPIYVSFSVPEERLGEIRAAGDSLPVVAVPPGEAGKPSRGTLSFVDNAVDPSSGTILLKAVFPNEDGGLWPGQFVNVRLRLRVLPDAVVVPASALQASQKGEFVYVVGADQTAEVRPVMVGTRLDGEVVIAGGVEAGETVVTDGQLRLTPGAKVTISSGLGSAGAE